MAKIYISSTSSDLQEFREAAYAQLRKSRHDAIAMQDYNPTSEPPLRKCLQDVREADIYVGLIGLCYGSIPETDNPDRLSYTELEYREALACGKQVLTFLTDPANWPAGKTDAYTGDHEKGARIDAFRKSIGKTHIRGSFWTEDNLAKALSPAVEEALRKLKPTNTAEQLDNLEGLGTEDLQNLAARFGIDDPYDTPDPELRRLLTMKADEFRALRKEVEAIDDGLKRLSNLKAAAQDAIARVDLDEVEELLSRVQEVELEEAAKTAELRAQNALLRGNVEQAYRLLSAAADSFAAIDPLEPARRRALGRHKAFPMLYMYGAKYGKEALLAARELAICSSFEKLKQTNEEEWLGIKSNIALCTRDLAQHYVGREREALLDEALSTFSDIQSFFEKSGRTLPIKTVMNFSYALSLKASTANRPLRDELIARGITLCENALADASSSESIGVLATTKVHYAELLNRMMHFNEFETNTAVATLAIQQCNDAIEMLDEKSSEIWAHAQNILGTVFADRSEDPTGKTDFELVAKSQDAFEKALTVWTKNDYPRLWVMAQTNLGHAILRLSEKGTWPEGRRHLEKAVELLRELEDFEIYDEGPEKWAMTKSILGAALSRLASNSPRSQAKRLYLEALEKHSESKQAHDKAKDPIGWANKRMNTAYVYLSRASHNEMKNKSEDLVDGLTEVNAAIDVYDAEHTSYEHTRAIKLREEILAAMEAL